MTTINNSIDFLRNYCQFEQPNHVWVLTGIVRNKDNKITTDWDRWMRRLIIRSQDDIVPCYNDIKAMGNIKGVNYRMYVSLNARDVTKTFFHFQQTLLQTSYDLCRGLEQIQDQIKRMDSIWKTELLQNNNRATKRFLLDVDAVDALLVSDIQTYLESITKVHAVRATLAGYHIVFEACDTRGLMEKFKGAPIDLQRDSLLYVESWEGQK